MPCLWALNAEMARGQVIARMLIIGKGQKIDNRPRMTTLLVPQVPSRELAVQRIAGGEMPIKTFIDMLMKE